MPVVIPREEQTLDFILRFLAMAEIKQAYRCSLGLTRTLDLCVLSLPTTENIRCVIISFQNILPNIEKSLLCGLSIIRSLQNRLIPYKINNS